MLQTLSDQEISPTHIAQLYGHKNFKSIENLSSLSTKQQQSTSNVLANISSEKVVSQHAVASNPLLLELRTLAQLQQTAAASQTSSRQCYFILSHSTWKMDRLISQQ